MLPRLDPSAKSRTLTPSSVCCAFWFIASVALAAGLGITLSGNGKDSSPPKFDVSGVGTCIQYDSTVYDDNKTVNNYWSDIVVSDGFNETLHPWLIDGGEFYVNEDVAKDHICHEYVKDYFVQLNRTVRHRMATGRRLQTWYGANGQ